MAVKLSTADYVLFALFLIASFAISMLSTIRGQANAMNYMLGGRRLSAIPVALSLFASFWSATAILGYPAETYVYGSQFWLICFGNMISSIFTAFLFVPKFRELNLVTLYEYLELRFHKSVKLAASLCFIVQMLLYVSVAIYAPSIALEQVTGLHIWISIVLVTVVCIIYTTIGGVKGVIWSDVLQSVIITIGLLTTLIIGLVKIGGFKVMAEDSMNSGRTEFFVFDFDPRVRHTFFAIVIGSSGMTLGVYSFNQVNVQRYLSLRSNRMVKSVVGINLFGLCFSVSVCLLLGMVIYSFYKSCDPVLNGTITEYNQIYPLFVTEILGNLPGFAGLFLATVCSGTMSTVSSTLNSLASVIFQDFICPWIADKAEFKWKLLLLRGLTIGLGLISLLLVLVVKNVGFILQAAISILGLYSGPITGLFLIGFFASFVKWKAALSGFVVSICFQTWLLVGSVVFAAKIRSPTKPLNTSSCASNATEWRPIEGPTSVTGIVGFYAISYMWHSITGILSCLIVSIIISLPLGDLKKKEKVDERLLIRFRLCEKLRHQANKLTRKELELNPVSTDRDAGNGHDPVSRPMARVPTCQA